MDKHIFGKKKVFEVFNSLNKYIECESVGHKYVLDTVVNNNVVILKCTECGYFEDFERVL